MQLKHPALARAAVLQAKFLAHAPQIAPVTTPIVAPSIAQLEARADDLRQSIIGYEAQLKDPVLNAELNLSAQYEALIDEADEEINAIEAQLDALEAPGDDLLGEHFMSVAPDLVGTIETLRGYLSAMFNCTATHHDFYAIEDAIARSGFLLRRANGEDTTAALAAYEASLLEAPDADDDAADDDFGRYGQGDD